MSDGALTTTKVIAVTVGASGSLRPRILDDSVMYLLEGSTWNMTLEVLGDFTDSQIHWQLHDSA